MNHTLVDELRLTVYPFVLGARDRLFDQVTDKTPFRLVEARVLGESLAFLTYQTVRGT